MPASQVAFDRHHCFGSVGMSQPPRTDRLAPLDALRGLAALGVSLFAHYQHFGGKKAEYPFAGSTAVAWTYENGWLFVDLFFLLSGIVLTYRYLEPLASGRVSGREFIWLRISRLYPLHVLTLLVCAAVEWTLLVRHEPVVIYPNNDLYNFFLQLFYLHTMFEHGWSYNEPTWSVCAEVLAYVLFFVYARRHSKNYVAACILTIILGIATQTNWSLPLLNPNMGRGLVGFFAGSLLFLAMRRLDLAGYGTRFGLACLGALAIVSFLGHRIGYGAWIGRSALPNCLAVFPLVIVTALRVPPVSALLSLRPLTFLGEISYAIYLVHVPLQMFTLAVSRARRVSLPTNSPWFLMGYFVVLIAVATAAHTFFERPARRWLRERSQGSRDLSTIPSAA
jgi:peptidoglycan/LPS O-acetylase OafA/YrhL